VKHRPEYPGDSRLFAFCSGIHNGYGAYNSLLLYCAKSPVRSEIRHRVDSG